jgi:hypothetical protein
MRDSPTGLAPTPNARRDASSSIIRSAAEGYEMLTRLPDDALCVTALIGHRFILRQRAVCAPANLHQVSERPLTGLG